jgi:hypothetical protein
MGLMPPGCKQARGGGGTGRVKGIRAYDGQMLMKSIARPQQHWRSYFKCP